MKTSKGAQFAYVQSDEISILLTDFDKVDTQAWFGGNVQKQVSISAAIVYGLLQCLQPIQQFSYDAANPPVLAISDSRVFVIPDPVEVYNCILWRVRDWERNSIQMLARSKYSHKELQGKGRADMDELLHKKETNWANLPAEIKRGRLIRRDADGKWVMIPMYKLPEQKEEFQKLIPVWGYE